MRAIASHTARQPASPQFEAMRALTPLRWLATSALIALIGLVAVTVALSRLAPLAGIETFVIRGGSMEPAIPLGSIVVAGAVDGAPGIGDVVIYKVPNGTVITHRVAGLLTVDGVTHLWTKGDANPQTDPLLVGPSEVLGRVELTIPALGFAAWLIGTPGGLVGVMTAAASLIMLLWLLQELEWSHAQRMRLLEGRL